MTMGELIRDRRAVKRMTVRRRVKRTVSEFIHSEWFLGTNVLGAMFLMLGAFGNIELSQEVLPKSGLILAGISIAWILIILLIKGEE